MFLRLAAVTAIASLAGGPVAPARAGDVLPVGLFSAAKAGGELPAGWKPLAFSGIDARTEYSLVEDAGRVVVRSESRASASGLLREIEIDPAVYPVVEWRWRVANVLEKGDVTRKSGDDYPARLYITFGYDPEQASLLQRVRYETLRLLYGEYPPVAALNYIWASRAPAGTLAPNPYTQQTQMIVVESGAAFVGEWRVERRNLAEDYRRAFGREAPRISGVAIMSDTDDTEESAVAWFGDIVFRSKGD
jgi:hypothetical protein